EVVVLDNALLDGSQSIMITASAPGVDPDLATITVHDNERATLSVLLPPEATEGQSPLQGMVTVSAAPAKTVAVRLQSSDVTEIQVPALAVIRAGQTSAVFTATVLDDTEIDGAQSVTVTASVENWTQGTATILVIDNE